MGQMDNKHDNIDNKSLKINLKNAPNKVKKAIDNKWIKKIWPEYYATNNSNSFK